MHKFSPGFTRTPKFGVSLQSKRGFTLIELLVVIAIIGILSSVVLASLNTARNKGSDTAVKSNLDNMRAQAELFYDANTNSYANVCGAAAVGGVNSIASGVTAAAAVNGLATVVVANNAAHAVQAASTAVCFDNSTGWVSSAPLKSSLTTYWCVSSSGQATTTSNVVAANAFVCS